MKTRERAELLSRAFPRLFPRIDLLRLLRAQLGSVNALDGGILRDGIRVRTRAPRLIYHICAGNLAVSACTSLAHGLLLGAHNVVKLPGDREDTTTRREIVAFIRHLPPPLRRLVTTQRALDSETLRRADVVIAFGAESTMASLRAQVRWDQRFIAHGPAVSLLWLDDAARFTARDARACATDVLTYDQLGCLSPQALYTPRARDMGLVGDRLAAALEHGWHAHTKKPRRSLAVAARIAEARDVARALGHRVWAPRHLGWTLIHDPDPAFQPSPLHGVLYLRSAAPRRLATALKSVAGRISTVGLIGARATDAFASPASQAFLSLGVSRFCPAGRMQSPPPTWHHDGRPPLTDLVTWIDAQEMA